MSKPSANEVLERIAANVGGGSVSGPRKQIDILEEIAENTEDLGSGGVASPPYDDTAIKNRLATVESSVTSFDGVIKAIQAEPSLRSTGRTNVLTKGMFGLYATGVTPAEGMTFLSMMEIEADALAFRIMVPNVSPDAIPGVRVAITNGNDFPDGHWITPVTPPGNEGWLPATFNGETSATLAPRVAPEIASWTAFDIQVKKTLPRLRGVRPVIAVRVQLPGNVAYSYPANGNIGWRVDDATHRTLRCTKQAVLGVDNIAAYTETASQDQMCLIPVVQYVTVNEGFQVHFCGDSTVEGIGASLRCLGAIPRACNALSTPEMPIEYVNSGMYAQGPLVYSKAVGYYSKLIKPSALFYSPYSINNTPAGGLPPYALDEDYLGLSRVLSDLRDLPRPPKIFLLQGLPTNPAYRDTGAGDQARRDLNTFLSTLESTTIVDGYVEAFTGIRLANGQDQIKAGLTDDNVHPNDAGYNALSDKVRPYLV